MGKGDKEALKRFAGHRFGMFIHFGLYSILNRRETAMRREQIPFGEYKKLIERFRPSGSAVEDWVRLARKSNMRYACLTARHGDGFSLFDSRANDFNSMHSSARRDIVREFTDACARHGIRPALYYAVSDQSDPGFIGGPDKNPDAWSRFVEMVHTQLKELMSNYGPVDYLFYDGCPPPETWGAAALNDELRLLQPGLLISDRCGLDEDIASSENHLRPHDKPWECCMTTNDSWGCNSGDINRKSLFTLVRALACCIHNGGNFLLNLGPAADGSPLMEDRQLFEGLASWIDRNSEAVYGTEPRPFNNMDQTLSCYRDNTAYCALAWYYGPETAISGIGNKVERARLLSANREIAFRQIGSRVILSGLPEGRPDVLPVVALELDGPPAGARNRYFSSFE